MENASKALVMAGSILIGLLVVVAVVIMFQNVSQLSTQDEQVETVKQITEFNAEYESYDRKDVYGSELLSLANRIVDYNLRESDAKGYLKMTGEVTLLQTWSKFKVEKNKTLKVDFTNIVSEIESTNQKATQVAQKLGGVSRADYLLNLSSNDLQKEIAKTGIKQSDVESYSTYKAYATEFKRKMFKCKGIKYDDKTGRIVKITFEEIDIGASMGR